MRLDRVGTFLRSRRDEGVEMIPLVLFGIFAWSVGRCVDGLSPPVRVLKGGEPIAGQAYAKLEEPGVYDRGPINLPTEVRKSAVQRFHELFFANTAAAWIAQQWIALTMPGAAHGVPVTSRRTGASRSTHLARSRSIRRDRGARLKL